MNPWTNIWTKTAETVDNLKDSNWVTRQGLLPYFIFGVNAASEIDRPLLLGYESKLENLIIFSTTLIVSGLLGGIIARAGWVNIIFYFGKIWNGQASRRNIDTAISLSLIPEIFKLASLILSCLIQDNIDGAKINYGVTIICFLVGFRILVIGLPRLQNFGYGISILNVFVPQLVLGLLYYSIRGL